MGQQTTGIMWGIIEPEDVDMSGEDGDSGLRGGWETACVKEIKKLERSKKLEPYERAESRFVPDTEYCCNIPLCGFWIAAGASGKGGVPDMPAAIDILAIETIEPYAAAIKVARERWQRFAAYAESQGVKLPPARLLLAETEVA